MSEILTQELTIRAPARIVYELLTDPRAFAEWMAVAAELEPWCNGMVRWQHANGDVCQGRFTELVPHSRVAFTYGWERADVGIPPGSTTVEIDLIEAEGVTTLRLVHRGLSAPAADAHAVGWRHYLDRLAIRAQGGDPGPDPWADQRVPSFL
ncbi:MAG: SRPBCC domain-containing protein [Chloroflexi bacterium]|nr:SRPBCC domain-containing protein [Chloroflexota bacterium]